MSLDWFKFYTKPFITDTLRLSTEAKGAYLMLILDYYDQGRPAPDDDETLATITGLSIEAWRRHRRVIEPLFNVHDGLWHHNKCAQVLAESGSKYQQKVDASKAAAEARRLKRLSGGSSSGSSPGQPSGTSNGASDDGSSGDRTVEPNFGSSNRPVHRTVDRPVDRIDHRTVEKTENSPNGASDGASDGLSNGTPGGLQNSRIEEGSREGANAPSPASGLLIGSLIDPAFMPNGAACSLAGSEGVLDQIGPWLDDWKDRCIDAGTRSTDWQLAWGREYDRRMKERAKARPKPRVAVSKKRLDRIPDGWQPGATHHKIADERRLNLAACVESFSDYIVNKRPDWKDADAAFRQWLKSPHRTEFLNGQTQTTQRRAPAPRGSIVDAVAELDAEFARRGAGGAAAEDQSHGGAAVLSLPED